MVKEHNALEARKGKPTVWMDKPLLCDFDYFERVADVVYVVELFAQPVEGHGDEAIVVRDQNRSTSFSIRLHSKI